MDRLESISTFVAVVEAGSLSAASRALRMPLATVSRKVGELETHLRVKLLERSTRRVVPTEAGQLFFQTCKRLIEELEEAERIASGEYSAPRGRLVISAPLVFGRLHLTPVVIEFLKAYPDVDVELRLADRIVDMVEEHVDAALRISRLADSGMMAIRLGEVRHSVCAAPSYLKERGMPRTLDDLSFHECITHASMALADEWQFQTSAGLKRVPVRSRMIATTAESALAGAVAGTGIARLLCYQIAEAVGAGQLVVLLRDHEPPSIPVHLVYPTARLTPQKLRAFLDFAPTRLKARLAQRDAQMARGGGC